MRIEERERENTHTVLKRKVKIFKKKKKLYYLLFLFFQLIQYLEIKQLRGYGLKKIKKNLETFSYVLTVFGLNNYLN